MKFKIGRKFMLSGLIFALSFLFCYPALAGTEKRWTDLKGGRHQARLEEEQKDQRKAAGEDGALIQGGIAMDVQYGYNDTAKGGRYVPVTVFLSEQSGQDFQGSIAISTMEADYQIYSYEYEIQLKGGESLEKSYTVPFGKGSDQVFVALTDQSGNQVAKKRLKMDINREVPEMFIGVLSDTPEKLQYLDGVGISYSAVKTRAIPLTKEEFPEETIGLSLIDVLLVSNYRLRDLSEAQTKAIMDWVNDGGVLILGTGDRVDDTLGRFAPELLDDNYDMPMPIDIHLGDEEEGQSILIQDISCADIPLHGADVLESEDGFPLFQAMAKEKGIIAVAAYDFADIGQYVQGEPAYMDGLFTKLLGEDRIRRLDDYFYGDGSDEYWAVQNVINSGNLNRMPNLSAYACVILLYIVLAGPVSWMFLKRREVQSYYWGAVTMLSLVFVAVIYLMGLGTRFRSTFVTYATIQDVSEESVIENSYVNVRSPYNKPYTLELAPDYSIRPINRNLTYFDSYTAKFTDSDKAKMTVRHSQEATRLDFHQSAAFESNYMELRKTTDNTNRSGITGEIFYFDGQITGTVTNQYDFPLEDCAALMYGRLVPLGDFQPGETKDLSEALFLSTPIGRNQFIAAKATGLDMYEKADINDKDYIQAMERANLLCFYMDRKLEGYRREARVVGFSQERQEQFMGNRKVEAYGLNMFTSVISVDNETDEGEICRSALMKMPTIQKGSYDYGTNSMYGSETVTLEYSLGNDIEVEEIAFCQVSQEFIGNQLLRKTDIFSGDIYFYNYDTGVYDKIDENQRTFSLGELLPYLSPGNTLTVKYIDSSQEGAGWDKILPMLMVKGREK